MLYVTKVVNKILQEILLTSICKYLEKIVEGQHNKTDDKSVNGILFDKATCQRSVPLRMFFPTWRVRFEIYLLFFNNFSSF